MTLGKSIGVTILTTEMLGNNKTVAQPTFRLFDMRYRRAKTPGTTYFFTVVTFRPRKILCEPENRELLRMAFRMMKSHHPFTIDAFVLLPEHLHSTAWTQEVEQRRSSCRAFGPFRRVTRIIQCAGTG